MKGLIVAGGEIKNLSILKDIAVKSDLIIAADSGYFYLSKIDVKPLYLVGDMDSLTKDLQNRAISAGVNLIKHPVEKDKTDSELAIDILHQLGATEIIVLGGTGCRLDHTLSNINSLRYMDKLGIKGSVIDELNEVRYLKSGESVDLLNKGLNVSILPISSEGAVVSLKGFHYELSRRRLNFGSSLGISNLIENSIGKISCHSGEIFIIEAKDK